jgi:hypothetical protein
MTDATNEPVDEAQDDEEQFSSWDAFWAEAQRRQLAARGLSPTVTIRGVEVRRPADLPIRFEQDVAAAEVADDDATFQLLLEKLFGVDVFTAWISAGMGRLEFRVIFTWALANGKGRPFTFEQAFEAVRASMEPPAGDTPAGDNPGKEPSSSPPTSGASANTGRRSRRTSAPPTSSTPTPSPT